MPPITDDARAPWAPHVVTPPVVCPEEGVDGVGEELVNKMPVERADRLAP